MSARRVGLQIPLFSCRSSTGWGIGELTDVVPMSRWLASAGFSQLLLLPLGTIRDGDTSPYSATSTLAIDPIYITLDAVADFARAGGVPRLSIEAQQALAEARQSRAVRHDLVRRAKTEALGAAFASFLVDEWEQHTTRAAELAVYIARERWWLDDYALFVVLARSTPGVSWREWPAALRDREPGAIDDARRQWSREILKQQYFQWIAESQWKRSRTAAAALGVALIGDLPFVANTESPEIWSRPQDFLLDVSCGVPPDAFSATGQDWGLPTYWWEAIAGTGYASIRLRARRMAALYDGLRVDHVIGLYRTYGYPAGGEPFFNPSDAASQLAQGEAVLTTLRTAGLELIAEDLGVVPDFLRPSLARLGIPGCKVMRWERDWHAPGSPFIDPVTYPALSAAMTGTHDTEPLALWWTRAPRDERAALLALPFFAEHGAADPDQPWTSRLGDLLVTLAYRSGSDQLFLPIQDLFGWPDRVNTPGTVGPENWTWALPWSLDAFGEEPEAVRRAAHLADLSRATHRLGASDYTRNPAARHSGTVYPAP